VLSQPAPLPEQLRRVAREVGRALGADMVGIYTADASGDRLVPVAGYRVPEALRQLLRDSPIVLSRMPALAEAWRTGRAISSGNPGADDRLDREWVLALPPLSVLCAPAPVHGLSVGAIFLVWWTPGRAFRPAEARLLEGVAAQVGLAMDNAELTRLREIKLQETETLLSVSRALSETLDLDALLRQLLRHVAAALGADTVGVFMREDGEDFLVPRAGYRVPPEILEASRRVRLSTVSHPFYAEAAHTRRPVFARDAATDPRIPAELRALVPHRSQLFVPIVAKDAMIGGFIAMWWETGRDLGAGELALMEAVASQAGVAVENARLFAQNRRQVEELSVLHELSRAVAGQLDRDALLDTMRLLVPAVLDSRTMTVLLLDEARGEFDAVLRMVDGGEDAEGVRRYPATLGLAAEVVRSGRSLRSEDCAMHCLRLGLGLPPGKSLRCWVGAPMRVAGTTLGVLALARDRPFSAADERLLLNIADLAALALRSAALFEERTRAYGELAAAQDHLVRTEKLRALGEMASGVAHDFNNLLAAILGRSQLLLHRLQDPTLRQWVQVIERAAADGAQTVKRLQEFARVRRDEPLVPVDLNQIVREALEITQARWREEALRRGIDLEVCTELVPLPSIDGDAAELREAMTNLILNAVDAMPAGGRLTLATAVCEDEVEVAVSDTGLGMPEAVRERIFDPFFTTKGPQGTGLGLSMTYGIISRHRGHIVVESEEARGSTFRLRFPAGAAAPAEPAPAPAGAADDAPLRCLVVDDEEAVGAVIGDVLEAVGHRAVVVSDGAAAIDRVRAEPFDAVFTDLAMPGLSGWQVAEAVKRQAPRTPVFLVTGFGVEVSAEEREASGVDGIYTKPLRIEDVMEAVARVARHRAGINRSEGR
jgi:signal transduction histidine kinase/ActR/RegA family two-component response regulator